LSRQSSAGDGAQRNGPSESRLGRTPVSAFGAFTSRQSPSFPSSFAIGVNRTNGGALKSIWPEISRSSAYVFFASSFFPAWN
jgi:hypothetical protein